MSFPNQRGRIGRRAIRNFTAAATAAALIVGASACGQGSSPSEADGAATIRVAWWGSAERAERMQEAFDLFEKENPDITVKADFTDWGGYWDKLSTSVAGNDTPDVMMQEDRYIGDYARQGVLADLEKVGVVQTGDIDESLLAAGNIDGVQYGIPTGSNVYSIVANKTMFEEAGVDLPDDTTWTWDDYVDLSQQISDSLGDGVYGTTDYSYSEIGFAVYARQHGQALYAEDGSLGYEDDLLEDWFQRSLDMEASGAQVPADENVTTDVSQTPIALRKAAMSMTWSAQFGATATAAGDEFVLLRVPGESEFERSGMYFKPGSYFAQSAKSEHPEAASKFIDFFVNSPEVGKIFLAELGVPGNSTVLKTVNEELTDADRTTADFVAALGEDIEDAPNAMPNGAGDVAEIMNRINLQVLFKQMTPADAAKQFRTETEAAIG